MAGICHGTTVLAWARVNGASPINGKQVAVPIKDGSPQMFYNGDWYSNGYVNGQYDQAIDNGGIPNTFNGQWGDPATTTDDVVVDGRIITGGDDWAAAYFGDVIAERVRANMPQNEAPTDLTISSATIAENSAIGTSVGAFTTSDPDVGDSFSYSLVEGAGATDNAAFTIDSGTLASAANFNHEAKSSYTVRIRTTDAGGLFFEKAFTIQIGDVNEAPFTLNLSNKSLDENMPADSFIGDFVAEDPDAGDTLAFSLVAGDGSHDNASFTIVDGELRSAGSLNFESQSSYRIRVRAADAGGLFTEATFEIQVRNINESPANLALSNNLIEEELPVGALIGLLSASDPDVGDSHSFTLANGNGDDDNASFAIDGHELKTAAILNMAVQETYSIRVRVQDADGLAVEKVFEIQLKEENDPPVIDNGPTLMLPLVARNAISPAGVPVASLLVRASDSETPGTLGIVIEGFKGIAGTWEYGSDTPLVWHSIGPAPLTLPNDAFVRFVPARNQTGYASIVFRAWDGESASVDSEIAWVPVGLRNLRYDDQGRWTLPAMKEDAKKSTTTIAKTMLGFLSTEFPAGTKLGLAVTASTGNGEWQFRCGGVWTAIDNVDEANARLIHGAEGIRFMPAANWTGEATITYRGWDPSNGITDTHADVLINAGFSSEAMTACVQVTPVNDAPLLETSIARLFNDDPQSVGFLLEGAADIDSTVAGVGILRSQDSGGTWQYRTSSNGEWTNMPKVSPTAALVLDPWCEVRFMPDAGATIASGRFEYKVWDASTGGNVGDRMNSNTTAFSNAFETATFSLGNQSPYFAAGDAASFGSIEGKPNPVAFTLKGILYRMKDADAGTQKGLAVTGLTGNGTWEFTIDNGKTWQAIGDVSSASLLLRSTDKVRFIPAAGWSGTATLEFAAWDRTMGVAGDRLDAPSDSLSVERLTATLAV